MSPADRPIGVDRFVTAAPEGNSSCIRGCGFFNASRRMPKNDPRTAESRCCCAVFDSRLAQLCNSVTPSCNVCNSVTMQTYPTPLLEQNQKVACDLLDNICAEKIKYERRWFRWTGRIFAIIAHCFCFMPMSNPKVGNSQCCCAVTATRQACCRLYDCELVVVD